MSTITWFVLVMLSSYSDQPTSLPISFEDIEGKWHIVYTNFPMWKKKKNTAPVLHYTVLENTKEPRVLDEVTYFKRGKGKTITGYDTWIDKSEGKVVWKGKGLLFFLKSRWQIVHYVPDDWAIIKFEKTLFTAGGYDVISRDRELSDDKLAEAKQWLEDQVGGLETFVKLEH